MLNRSKSKVICRQNNENLIHVDIPVHLVVLGTSSKNGSVMFIVVKIVTNASCIVNCQFREQLSDAMVKLNRRDRSLNGFKNIVK